MHVLNNVYLFSLLCSIVFSSAFSSSLLVVVSFFFFFFFLCVPHFSEIGSQSSGVGKTVMLFSICEVFASFSGAFFFFACSATVAITASTNSQVTLLFPANKQLLFLEEM